MKKWLILGVFSMNMQSTEFKLFSLDFQNDKKIPKEFTCEGSNKIPKLAWEHAPKNTASFALICDDPDAPKGTWVHWVIYNIPANKRTLDHVKDRSEKLTDGTMQGSNSWPKIGYDGPCPPKGHGTHHYHFKLYALDTMLQLPPKATKDQLEKTMAGHILAETQIIGLYERS